MESQGKGNPEGEPTVPTGMVPPRKPSGNAKWYAIIIVLLVVAAAFAVLAFYHPAPPITGPQATLAPSVGTLVAGQAYNFTINATGSFSDIKVLYGDGTNQTVKYANSNSVKLSHTYANPGEYYILYTINYSASNQPSYLIPVKVSIGTVGQNAAYRILTVDQFASSQQLAYNTSNIFKPGSFVTLDVGANPGTPGGVYEVVSQQLTMFNGSEVYGQQNYPYVYNTGTQAYQTPMQNVKYTNLPAGFYILQVNTTTAQVAFTQTITTSVTNVTTQSFATTQYGFSAGTTLGNISKVSLTSPRTNVTFSNATNVLFSGTPVLYLGTDTNLTLHTGSITNSTGTFNTAGYYSFSASDQLTLGANTNVTFNVATTTELNQTPTSMEFYGVNSNVTFVQPVIVTFTTAAPNALVTAVLSGTTTVPLNNGSYDQSAALTTSYYIDMPVYNHINYTPAAATQFLNSELETGAYKTLDPAIEYDTVSNEILANTMSTLDVYQGSSNSTFAPYAAAYLPSTTNGGINSNYANWTVNTPWGSTFTESVVPGQNYTFHIRANATFQDGSSMTAWDVYYSMVRVLLFDAGTPGTPGWIIAQSMLPGDYYSTNTFFNITQNMTVNNATENITFHFQSALSPTFVFETIGYDLYIADANWMVAHGTAQTPALSWKGGVNTLPWNAKGFADYANQGNQGSYNTYFVNHIMASGPYEVSYIVPSSQVVLVKNPNFNSPNMWTPAAHINTVVLQYIGQPSTNYLLLSSGQAQAAGLPVSSWGQVAGLIQKGVVNDYAIPTLSIFWYNFNTRVNMSVLTGIVSNANLPFSMFTNYFARKAFAYAFNYTQAVQTQFGNPDYPTVPFASEYAGMLPPGMAFAQNISDLNKVTNGVPYFDLALAKAYWNWAVNGTGNGYNNLHSQGVTYSNGFQENGKQLVIPIFIFSADPASLAATTTWAGYLQQVIPGASFPIEPTAFPALIGYQVQGQNPMPVYELGWAPDYPYPSDYLGPMAYPSNSSTYPGPNSMNAWWIGGGNVTVNNPLANSSQAQNLTQMRSWYNTATSTSNVNTAEQYFHMMNEMLINMTFYTYIFQQYQHFPISSKILKSSVMNYQENIMVMGQAGLRYSALQYA